VAEASDLLGSRGARRGVRHGRTRAVLSFGDPVAEARALEEGAGVVPLEGLATWEASGGAAISFLHRVLTQDVKGIPDGGGRPALLLDARGRIHADAFLWRRAGSALLVLEPASAVGGIPLLERYVVADDVVLTDVSASLAHLLLAGARVPALLEAAGGALARAGALVARCDLRSRPGARIAVPVDARDGVLEALLASGGAPAGEEALDAARVETLTPWWGSETDERVLPNEAVLDAAISWTKGCYLGQEAVVMARHRGHPPSLLVRLSLEGSAVPAPGTPVLRDGRPVGRVTTAVAVRDGRPRALAYVRWDDAKAGTACEAGEPPRPARIDAVAG
jgi:folate-binding protein YgfZ